MQSKYWLALALVALSGCKSVSEQPDPNQIKYVDLSSEAKKDLVEQYWQVTKRVEPAYSIDAAKKGLSGCVTATVGIGATGEMVGYKITDSFPKGVFDSQGLAALKKWRWQATEANVDKVPVLTSIKLDFMVHGPDSRGNLAAAKEHCQFGKAPNQS
ncbi:energy transducer TonB [Shewanella sp. C32]|uniref:Energy transducer TonB n=1 Tax=Shewanella electrica TaxID=515560 RepID=A0ABT2FHK3_9GAMM|nr:energy transducer TonB [Shewanella electrica]MCH1923872.1 energy transducer TonB [Shewanella electrica]MCS4555776.1 energy transducer TonB [Shewanella electrica]